MIVTFRSSRPEIFYKDYSKAFYKTHKKAVVPEFFLNTVADY